MTEAKTFIPVKLICGMISSQNIVFRKAEDFLKDLYGPIDFISPLITFTFTDYYEKEMGTNLKRKFLSFKILIPPENLSEIKIRTNELEEELKLKSVTTQRTIKLDPGFLSALWLPQRTLPTGFPFNTIYMLIWNFSLEKMISELWSGPILTSKQRVIKISLKQSEKCIWSS